MDYRGYREIFNKRLDENISNEKNFDRSYNYYYKDEKIAKIESEKIFDTSFVTACSITVTTVALIVTIGFGVSNSITDTSYWLLIVILSLMVILAIVIIFFSDYRRQKMYNLVLEQRAIESADALYEHRKGKE